MHDRTRMTIMHCHIRSSHSSPGAESVEQQWRGSFQSGGGEQHLTFDISIQKCRPWSCDWLDLVTLVTLSSLTVNFVIFILYYKIVVDVWDFDLKCMLFILPSPLGSCSSLFVVSKGSCWPRQAEQPAARAEGPSWEGAEGGEGAAWEGVGRVQNENSLLWIRGETSAV